jgi:predicted transposase/invertase (TIGR01784 family)
MKYVTTIERMGIEQGFEQGRQEEKKAIALNMLRKNLDLETIAEITGLTLTQLQEMQAQVN